MNHYYKTAGPRSPGCWKIRQGWPPPRFDPTPRARPRRPGRWPHRTGGSGRRPGRKYRWPVCTTRRQMLLYFRRRPLRRRARRQFLQPMVTANSAIGLWRLRQQRRGQKPGSRGDRVGDATTAWRESPACRGRRACTAGELIGLAPACRPAPPPADPIHPRPALRTWPRRLNPPDDARRRWPSTGSATDGEKQGHQQLRGPRRLRTLTEAVIRLATTWTPESDSASHPHGKISTGFQRPRLGRQGEDPVDSSGGGLRGALNGTGRRPEHVNVPGAKRLAGHWIDQGYNSAAMT